MEIPKQPRLLLRQEGCSLKTDSRAPLLKTTPTQLTEHGEVKLVPTWSPLPYVLPLQCRKALYVLPKGKCGHQSNHKTLDLQSVLPAQYVMAMVAPNLREQPTNV